MAVSMTIFPAFLTYRTVKIKLIKMMPWNSLQNQRYGNCPNLQEKKTETLLEWKTDIQPDLPKGLNLQFKAEICEQCDDCQRRDCENDALS